MAPDRTSLSAAVTPGGAALARAYKVQFVRPPTLISCFARLLPGIPLVATGLSQYRFPTPAKSGVGIDLLLSSSATYNDALCALLHLNGGLSGGIVRCAGIR